MPQAKITVNAVVGSNVVLPINTIVSLDNQNIGGEASFSWTILDQPPGTADVLSASTIQNPTFTPKKEGTYLIKLIVNSGLPTEQEDRVVCGVRQLKTLERIPAAGETTEADTSDGWATSMNSLLRRVDTLLSDPGIIVGVNAHGSTLTRGQVVRCTAASVIKSGLPGQETVPGFSLSTAATLPEVDELLAIVEGTPAGVSSVGNGELMKVRYIGRIASQVIANGPVAVGDVIFVNDSGALDATEGTVRRRVGSAMTAGATADVWFNGVGGADIDLTPIDRAYVVYGNPGALPNAFRVDGVTNMSAVSGGDSFAIDTSDNTTITFVLRRNSSSGLAMQQWQSEAAAVLAQVLANGKLELSNGISSSTGTLNLLLQTNHSAEFGSSAATYTQMLLSNAAYNVQMRATNAGPFQIATSAAIAMDFATNATSRWRILATGELQAQGANRAIQSVLDPVGAQDAATKNSQDTGDATTLAQAQYSDVGLISNNIIINGGFDFFQRGTPINADESARIYGPDRWALSATADDDSTTFTVERVANGITGSRAPYAARVTVTGIDPDAGDDWSISVVQEIDRDLVFRARGRKLLLRMLLADGASWSGDVRIDVVYGTGAVTQTVETPYTGATTLYTLTTSVAALTSVSVLIPTAVPATATTMCLRIFADRALVPSLSAPEFFDVSDITLVPVNASLTAVPSGFEWARAGGTLQGELELCQRYFEKSYDVDTAPAAATSLGQQLAHYDTGGSLGQNVYFQVRKARIPTLAFYNPSTGAATWIHSGGTTGINPLTISMRSFDPDATGVPNAVGANRLIRGHWTADAEI